MSRWHPARILVGLAGLSILPVAWLVLNWSVHRKVDISPEERKELMTSIKDALDRGQERGRLRSEGMKVAGTWVPRPDLGPCPTPQPPWAEDVETLWANHSDSFGQGGVSWWRAMSELQSWQQRLGRQSLLRKDYTHDELLRGVHASIELLQSGYDYRLIIDEEVKPTAEDRPGGQHLYRGGSIRGRLLVWSHESKSVVCAGEVRAASSETVATLHFPDEVGNDGALASLLGNLHEQAVRSGLSHLVKAGPPN